MSESVENSDTLLFPLFDELRRRRRMPLGISEYAAAVQCVCHGLGLEDPERLKETLCLIWAKSKEDRELLADQFRILVEPVLCLRQEPTETKTEPTETQAQAIPGSPHLDLSLDQRARVKGTSEATGQPPCARPATYRPLPERSYQLIPRFPVTRREMTRAFRHLRQMQRLGPPEELDIAETLERIGKTGFFLGPVLRPLRRNRAELLLLIDRKGSMDPFLPLVNRLVESILHGGLLGQVRVYYFHDCPEDFLFENERLTVPIPVDDVLNAQRNGEAVLFVSDAGAAKGDYDKDRIERTREVAEKLGPAIHRCAWLNPVPKSRWIDTTAEAIADLEGICMFPLTRDGLNDAVNRMRGNT